MKRFHVTVAAKAVSYGYSNSQNGNPYPRDMSGIGGLMKDKPTRGTFRQAELMLPAPWLIEADYV
jgi:hypothetical protein